MKISDENKWQDDPEKLQRYRKTFRECIDNSEYKEYMREFLPSLSETN